jgi:hypothetical protein
MLGYVTQFNRLLHYSSKTSDDLRHFRMYLPVHSAVLSELIDASVHHNQKLNLIVPVVS